MAVVKKISNIAYMPVVEHISRKFALRRETLGTKTYQGKQVRVSNGFMGAGVREKRIGGDFVKCNYFFMKKYGRSTPLSAKETRARADFQDAQGWVKDAMEDLAVIVTNQQKYQQSLESGKKIKGYWAGNYNSVRSWMVAIAITMRHDNETLPQDHNLPAFDA